MAQRKRTDPKTRSEKSINLNSNEGVDSVEVKGRKKLTYKLEFELKNLPIKIQKKEEEIEFFTKKLSDSDFYKNDSDAFMAMAEKLEVAKGDLEYYETRWLELESEKE